MRFGTKMAEYFPVEVITALMKTGMMKKIRLGMALLSMAHIKLLVKLMVGLLRILGEELKAR